MRLVVMVASSYNISKIEHCWRWIAMESENDAEHRF